jgi:hypothetical protein
MSNAATRRVASLNAHIAPGGSHGGSVRPHPRAYDEISSGTSHPNPNPVFPNRRRTRASLGS